MSKMLTIVSGVMVALAALAAPAAAQVRLDTRPIPAPAEAGAIPLDTGGMPGMPAESWFREAGDRVAVRNVSRATLTPILPPPGKATGAAVIVAPGGGFRFLAMENEGWPVARWLADRGIAAFVLKYRLNATPATAQAFEQALRSMMAPSAGIRPALTVPPAAIADAQAALRLVRARAGDWKVDPARVGLLGFSAGAMTAMQTALTEKGADTPAFLGLIYGPMTAVTVPASAPPLFVSLAADDPLFGKQGYGLAESWLSAGKPVELHVFEKGGHGYGMGREGTTTWGWMESFHRWMQTSGWLAARR